MVVRSMFPTPSPHQAGHPVLARSTMALLGKEEGFSNCFQHRAGAFFYEQPSGL